MRRYSPRDEGLRLARTIAWRGRVALLTGSSGRSSRPRATLQGSMDDRTARDASLGPLHTPQRSADKHGSEEGFFRSPTIEVESPEYGNRVPSTAPGDDRPPNRVDDTDTPTPADDDTAAKLGDDTATKLTVPPPVARTMHKIGTGSVVHWEPFGRPISTSNQSTFGHLLVMRPVPAALAPWGMLCRCMLSLYDVTCECTADRFGRKVPSTPAPDDVRYILLP